MSKNVVKASGEAQDAQKSNSILDYLYCDTPRIASFLAQFHDAGHLLKITESESAVTGSRRGFRVGGGATVMGTGGHLNVERTPGEGGSEATERVYDPLWANARAFMDHLDSENMMGTDLASAHFGQFVLVSGTLEIRDLKLIQKAMAVLKSVAERHAPPGAAPQSQDSRHRSKAWHDRQALEQKAQDEARASEAGIEFMTMLPHAVHAVLYSGSASVWCSLRPDCLIASPDDIFLKHGVVIPGEWSILGILDAHPDPETVEPPTEQYAADRDFLFTRYAP